MNEILATRERVRPAWRPFVSRDLISRRPSHRDHGAVMLIDPWTQRWAITAAAAAAVLPFADGSRTCEDIARDCGLPEFTHPERIRGLLEHLREAGIVYGSPAHHRHRGRPVYNTVDIQGLHLEITNACNLRCTHCYVSAGRKLPDELSTDELRAVIDQLTPFGTQRLYLTGGEAVVRPDCMDLVEYAAIERGLQVDLYSNAYKFPRRFAERIVAVNEAGAGSVRLQVSIEGADAATNDAVRGRGAFAEVDRSMQMFRELGLHRRVTVLACVTSANIAQVPAMIELAESWDVERIAFSQWQRQGNAADTPWRSIAPSAEQWCDAGQLLLDYSNPRLTVLGNFFGDLNNDSRGRFSIAAPLFPKHLYAYNAVPRVSPDGKIFADQFWDSPDWSLGNVRQMTLAEAFRTDAYRQQLAAFEQRWQHVPECKACPWLRLCEAGSPGHTHTEYGDVDHRDLFCDSRRYWFQAYVDHQFTQLPRHHG